LGVELLTDGGPFCVLWTVTAERMRQIGFQDSEFLTAGQS